MYHQGDLLGRIREVPVCCTRKHLEVWDSNEQKLYDITGPCCPIGCGTDVPFQVLIDILIYFYLELKIFKKYINLI